MFHRNVLGVNVQHTTGASETLIPAAEVDSSNAVLAQHGRAHDAGLYGHVEVGVLESTDWVIGQDACEGDELGVPGTVEGAVRFIHAATKDAAVFDKDTANGGLIARER